MAIDDSERWMDEATKRLARKRQLAKMLEEQSLKFNLPNPHARASWANVGDTLANALVGRLKGEEADAEGKKYEQEQSDALARAVQAGKAIPAGEDMSMHVVDYENQPPPEQMGPPAPEQPSDIRNLGSIDVVGKKEELPPLVPQLGKGPTGTPLVPKPLDMSAFASASAPPATGAPTDAAAAAEQKAGLRPGILNTFRMLERSPTGSVSPKGAAGPYQVMPENVAAYSKQEGRQLDPNDPADSALMASKVAADAKRRYPDNERAQVAYYNGGWRAGDAVAAGKTTTNPETDAYLKRYESINQGPTAPDATMLAANAPSPIPPLPAPGPTPPPTLAGPAVRGAVPPPTKVEEGGGVTDEQWNAMAATPSPAGTPYPAAAPEPPALVPQPPAAAVAPPAPPKKPMMLPAQASQLSTTQGMLEFVASLPPGAMKNRMLDTVMKEVTEEPGKIRKLEQEAAIHAQQSRDFRGNTEMHERTAAANNATQLQIAQLKAAADRGIHKQIAGLDEDNVVVSYDPSGNGSLVRADGKPPVGAVMPLNAVQRDVHVARTIGASIKKADSILKDVENNKGAFGGWDSAKVDVAGIFGPQVKGWAQKKIYTQPELEVRARVGYEGAQILHALYGAALTKTEQKNADPFQYKQGDPPELIMYKIDALKKLIDYKESELSPQARKYVGGGDSGESEAEKELRRRRGGT